MPVNSLALRSALILDKSTLLVMFSTVSPTILVTLRPLYATFLVVSIGKLPFW
jgi:hypothetical protein